MEIEKPAKQLAMFFKQAQGQRLVLLGHRTVAHDIFCLPKLRSCLSESEELARARQRDVKWWCYAGDGSPWARQGVGLFEHDVWSGPNQLKGIGDRKDPQLRIECKDCREAVGESAVIGHSRVISSRIGSAHSDDFQS